MMQGGDERAISLAPASQWTVWRDACLTMPRVLSALWFISLICPMGSKTLSVLFPQLGQEKFKQREKKGRGMRVIIMRNN